MSSNPPFRDRAREGLQRPPGAVKPSLDPLDPEQIIRDARSSPIGEQNVRNLAAGLQKGSITPEAARSYLEDVSAAKSSRTSGDDLVAPAVTEQQAQTPVASFDRRTPPDRAREMTEFRRFFNEPEPNARRNLRASVLPPPTGAAAPTVVGPAQRAVAATAGRDLPKPPGTEVRLGEKLQLTDVGQTGLDQPMPFDPAQQRQRIREINEQQRQAIRSFNQGIRQPERPVAARNPRVFDPNEPAGIVAQKALQNASGISGGLFASNPAALEQARLLEAGRLPQGEPPPEVQGEGFEPLRNLWRGLAGGTLGVLESTGTILRYLGGEFNLESVAALGERVEDYFQPRMQEFQRAAAKNFRADQNIWDNPELLLDLDFLTYTVGQIIPSLLVSITPAGLARAAVKKTLERQLAKQVGRKGAVGKAAETSKDYLKIGNYSVFVGKTEQGAANIAKLNRIGKAAAAAGLAAGGVAGGALEGSSTYRETYDTLLEQGVPEDVARATAENAFLMMTAASGALNAVGLERLVKAVPALGSWDGVKARTLRGLQEAITEYLEGPAESLIMTAQGTITPEQAIQKMKEELNVAPAAFLTAFFLPGSGRLLGFDNDSIKPAAQEAADAMEVEQQDIPDDGGLPPVDPPSGPAGQAVNVTTPEASGIAQAEQEEVDETTQQEPDESETKPKTGKAAEKRKSGAKAKQKKSPEPAPAEDEVITGEDLVSEPQYMPEPAAGEDLTLTARAALQIDIEDNLNDAQLEDLAVELGIDRINAGESRSAFVERIQERAESVLEGQDAPAAQPAGIFEQERAAELEAQPEPGAEAEYEPEPTEAQLEAREQEETEYQIVSDKGKYTVFSDGAPIATVNNRKEAKAAIERDKQGLPPVEVEEAEEAGVPQTLSKEQRKKVDSLQDGDSIEVVGTTKDDYVVFAYREDGDIQYELAGPDYDGPEDALGTWDTYEEAVAEYSKYVAPQEQADAETVREDQAAVPEQGAVSEGSGRKGGEDIQQPTGRAEREERPDRKGQARKAEAKGKPAKTTKQVEKPKNIIDTRRLGEVFDNPAWELTKEDVNLDVFSADELKEVLRERGLKVGGNKSVLRDRLIENQQRGIAAAMTQGKLLSDTARQSIVKTEKGDLSVDEGFNQNLGMRTFTATDSKGKKAAEVFVNPDDETLASIEVDENLRGAGVANKIMDEIESVTGKKLKPSDNLSYDGYRMWVKRDPKAVDGSYHEFREQVLGKVFNVPGEGDVQVVDMGNQRLSVRLPSKPGVVFALRPEQAEIIIERAKQDAEFKSLTPKQRIERLRKRKQQLREADELGEPLFSDSLYDNESIDALLERERESEGIVVEEIRLPNGEIPYPVGRTQEEVRANLRRNGFNVDDKVEKESQIAFGVSGFTTDQGDFTVSVQDEYVEINLELNGRQIGYIGGEIREDEGVVMVRVAEVSRDMRGRKLGQEMIKQMHAWAEKNGLGYQSDETVSSDQLRAYEALGRKGWEIIYTDPIHVADVLDRAEGQATPVFSYIMVGTPIVRSVKSPAQVDAEIFGAEDFADPLFKSEEPTKRVTLTDAERAAIKKVADKAGVDENKVLAQYQKDRRKHYPKDGWARLVPKGLKKNKRGDVTAIVYEEIPYDFHVDPKTGKAYTKSKQNQQRQQTKIRRLADKLVKEVRKVQKAAAEGEQWAIDIMRQRVWYTAVTKRLRNEFGGAADLIADLLGATSPKTPVEQNFKQTVDAAQQLSAGKFDAVMKEFVQYLEENGTPKGYDGPKITKINGKKYGTNTTSTMLAMAKVWRVVRPGTAPKARNFTGNLIGFSDMPTIDVWAARLLQRLARGKRIPPKAEGAVKGNLGAQLTATGQFGFGQEVMTLAAEELGMLPKDLQAVAWFMEKKEWSDNNWTTEEGSGGSFEEQLDFVNLNRVLSGLSIQVGSKAPSRSAVRKAQNNIKSFFQQVRGVLSFRQASTLGLYDGVVERSFDVEASVTPTFDYSEFVANQAQIAQGANQVDLFVSRVVGLEEENPNARPGIEVFFDGAKSLKEVQPILDSLVADGIDGFTMVVDPRARLFGIDNRKFIGVRYQYVPEIQARYDEDFRKEFRRDGMAAILEEKTKQLIAAADSLLELGASSYHIFQYDTLVVGQENYSEYTNPAGTANQATGRVWFGTPIDQSVEAAISRIESGEAAERKRVQRSGDATGSEGGQEGQASLEERAGRSKPRSVRSPVPLARLTDTYGQARTEIYGRFGALEDKDTTNDLKIYNLEPLVQDKDAALNQAAQHGFLVKLFSFVEDKENGIEFKIPSLKKDGYEHGTVWIYNPRNPAGSFKDEDYTTAWRITHEVAHGITEQFMEQKYGESKRFGRMGRTMAGMRGKPPKQKEVTLPPLTLKHAQRAVEWEEVTFRVQRMLLEELGITITDEQFNMENRINLADAMYRSLTGEFGDPGEYGFVPETTYLDVKDVLIALEETEQLLAADQNREPTEGINLNTWQRVPEAALRTAIREAKQNGRPTATEKAASVGQSATGAVLTAKDFRPRAEVSEVAPATGATSASDGAVSEQHDPHDGDVLFRNDDRTVIYRDKDAKSEPTGVKEDEARFAILDIINKIGNLVGIRVVQSQSELPTTHKSRVQGIFYPKANILYIVADNHSSLAEIKKTILHEVFGHFTMRSMPGFSTLKSTVKGIIDRSDDKTLNRVVQDVQARGTVKNPDLFIEEVIAHMAEESTGRNAVMKEFIAAVQEFIRALGFDVKINNADIIALIRQQRRRIERNAQAAAAFGFTRNSEEFKQFLKSDNMSKLRSARTDREIGEALEALAFEFDKPLFSDSAKMTGALEDAWAEKMNKPLREMSWPDRIKKMAQAFADLSFDDMTQGLIDSANAVKKNEIEAFGELLDASVSPYKSMSTIRNLNNVMGAVMRHGIPDLVENVYETVSGDKIKGLNFVSPEDGISFAEIFAPLKEIPGASQMRNWETYVVAVRALDIIAKDRRAGRTGDKRREKLIDEDLAKETVEWAQQQVAPNGKTYAEIFEEARKNWIKLNQKNIDLAIKTGVLNEAEAKIWKDDPYVPFWRELAQLEERQQPGSGRTRTDVSSAGIYRLTGSLDRDGNPVKLEGNIIESMFMNTAYLIDRSYRNEATRRVIDLGQKTGAIERMPKSARPVLTVSKKELIQILWKTGILNAQSTKEAKKEFDKMPKTDRDRYQTFFSRVKPPGGNIITLMKDGKQEYYRVDDPLLLRSIVGVNETSGTWMTLMRGSKKWLTVGVTTDPAFMLANWMRDTITTFIVSDAPMKSLADPIKGLRDAWGDSPTLMHLAFAGRGGGNLYDTHPEKIVNLLKELGVEDTAGFMKTVVSPRKLWTFWREIGSASEFGNRVRVYNNLVADWNKRIAALQSQGLSPQEAWQQAVRDGYTTPAEAAFQAQDLLNFTRSGDYRAMQIAIQVIPFLNARVQGLNRLYRGAKESPMAFTIKGGSLMMATLMLAALNDDDDRYNELSEWDKDTYYHFWIGDQHYRLPKPFESGVIFSTSVERIYRSLRGIDGWDVAGDSAIHSLVSTFMFNPIPQLFKPWVEDYFNHNIFMDTPIVSAGQENLLPERQYDFRTGEFAKWFGQTLPDAAPDWMQSPKRFEALIRGFFGALGIYTLSAANVMTDTLISGPDRVLGELQAKRLHELPVISRFVRGDVATTTKYNRILWELVREADAIARTIKVYQEEGQGEKAFELARDNREIVALRPRIRQIAGQVSEINKQLNQIAMNRRISPERRAAIRDKLLARRNALAKQIDPLIEFL